MESFVARPIRQAQPVFLSDDRDGGLVIVFDEEMLKADARAVAIFSSVGSVGNSCPLYLR